jgi:hypothetical protein
MLKLLQPGVQPLGQFDIEDDDMSLVTGGEVAAFVALTTTTDAYAADVFQQGPQYQLTLRDVSADGVLYGLVDEGTSSATPGHGYGTLFGTVIGSVTGQGTGMGGKPTVGAVVVGPHTMTGSGKATLWTKPGLYGVTVDAWYDSAQFTAATLNAKLYGKTKDGTNDGKLTTSTVNTAVALVLGPVADTSLVSTTNVAAGGTSAVEFMAIYLLGVQT